MLVDLSVFEDRALQCGSIQSRLSVKDPIVYLNIFEEADLAMQILGLTVCELALLALRTPNTKIN